MNKTVNRLEGIDRWTRIRCRSGISRRDFLKSSLSTLAAPLLLSCRKSSTEPSFGNPKLTARPGTPNKAPTIGVSQLALEDSRGGILYVPKSYSSETPAPLFVALHGAGGDGDNWSGYYSHAEERGMILLAPDSRSYTWDLIRDDFGPDVEFLERALRHTFERCLIDPTRLALGGFSDGASYTLSLALPNGDLFSHLVAYSPGFIAAHLSLSFKGKPRIFISHGTQDSILPVTGSRDSIVPYLQNAGYDVTYEEFDGGHQVPAVVTESALEWFLNAG